MLIVFAEGLKVETQPQGGHWSKASQRLKRKEASNVFLLCALTRKFKSEQFDYRRLVRVIKSGKDSRLSRPPRFFKD